MTPSLAINITIKRDYLGMSMKCILGVTFCVLSLAACSFSIGVTNSPPLHNAGSGSKNVSS
jgi:hypothetical protein